MLNTTQCCRCSQFGFSLNENLPSCIHTFCKNTQAWTPSFWKCILWSVMSIFISYMTQLNIHKGKIVTKPPAEDPEVPPIWCPYMCALRIDVPNLCPCSADLIVTISLGPDRLQHSRRVIIAKVGNLLQPR